MVKPSFAAQRALGEPQNPEAAQALDTSTELAMAATGTEPCPPTVYCGKEGIAVDF